tara:strand:- start:11 stop:238 length:228 start_codon:yes stop_codon:yes gene_type:complete
MNSEVDINVLVTLYNKKLSALTNQNVLLEAKIQTLTQEFEDEKNRLLAQLLELKKVEPVSIPPTDDDYQNSEVEE